MRTIQSLRCTNTNKPVKNTVKVMQLATAIIAGLKSDATTGTCVACRALLIKNVIIAKYAAIIARASPNRKAPNLLAVTDD
jgi:hypothetical protein